MSGFRVERLLPIACVLGALILIGTEFSEVFRFVPLVPDDSGQTIAVEAVTGADRHSFAMLILGLFAISGTFIAIWAGSRAAALSVAIIGVAALVLFLIVDLPDAGTTGVLTGSRVGFVEVETVTLAGFWLGMAGAVILAVSGAAMATLSSGQLSALRPGEGGPERDAGDTDPDDLEPGDANGDRGPETHSTRRHEPRPGRAKRGEEPKSTRSRPKEQRPAPSAEERSRARREAAARRSGPKPNESS